MSLSLRPELLCTEFYGTICAHFAYKKISIATEEVQKLYRQTDWTENITCPAYSDGIGTFKWQSLLIQMWNGP